MYRLFLLINDLPGIISKIFRVAVHSETLSHKITSLGIMGFISWSLKLLKHHSTVASRSLRRTLIYFFIVLGGVASRTADVYFSSAWTNF